MLSEQSHWSQQTQRTAEIDKVFSLIGAEILIPQWPSQSKRITFGGKYPGTTHSYIYGCYSKTIKILFDTSLNNGCD